MLMMYFVKWKFIRTISFTTNYRFNIYDYDYTSHLVRLYFFP